MLEVDIENYLVKRVRELGGVAWKWVSPGRPGVPDRIVLLPDGVVLLVELKKHDGQVRGVQTFVAKILARLGFVVHMPRSIEDVDALLAGFAQ